jgi:hypothetical protein
MGKSEQKAKDQARAAYLIRIGYPHGRRMTTGLSNIPSNDPGSAAYRRIQAKKRGNR